MSYSFSLSLAFPNFSKILLSTFKYRSRLNIVVDILDLLKKRPEGMTKTDIMQYAKLNYKQTKRFINLLMVCDLIRAEPLNYGERKLTCYALTHHGLEFLEIFQNMHFAKALLEQKAL
jgi:predicted transcriptional regulator